LATLKQKTLWSAFVTFLLQVLAKVFSNEAPTDRQLFTNLIIIPNQKQHFNCQGCG